jgi:RHS repeat-associated protein
VDYAYDGVRRLVEERIDEPGTDADRIIGYEYDAVGNRLVRSVAVGDRTATTTYAYNENDQLLSETTRATEGVAFAASDPSRQRASLRAAAWVSGAYLALSLAVLTLGGARACMLLVRNRGTRRWVLLRASAVRTLGATLAVGIAVDARLVHALGGAAYPGEAAVSSPGVAVLADEVITYSYADNGNLVSRSDGTLTDRYTYDFENRLVQAELELGPEPGSVEYAYDADGNRTSKTLDGVTTSYVVDRNRELPVVLEAWTGADVVRFTHGDDLISQERSAGEKSFYAYDGMLSIRQLIDSSGNVTDSYTYDAYGIVLSADGDTPNDFGYTGQQFDPNIGFYYLRARYYAQAQGRLTSADPFEGSVFDPRSLHRYLYANADPVNNHDPSGRQVSILGIQLTLSNIALISLAAGLAAGTILYLLTENLYVAIIGGIAVAALTFVVLFRISRGQIGPDALNTVKNAHSGAVRTWRLGKNPQGAQQTLRKWLEENLKGKVFDWRCYFMKTLIDFAAKRVITEIVPGGQNLPSVSRRHPPGRYINEVLKPVKKAVCKGQKLGQSC